MKRHILVGSVLLLFGAVITDGVDLAGVPFCEKSQNGIATYREGELVVRFAAVEPGRQPAEGPVIVGPRARRTVRDMMSDYIVPGAAVRKEYDGVVEGLAVVNLPGGVSISDALVRFNSSANVLYAEPNYRFRLAAIPSDPNYVNQWGLDNIGQTGGFPDADVDAPEAWDITTGDPNVIVAVMDTGVDYGHPDLAGNMWVNDSEVDGLPGVDDDDNGYVDDIYGYDFAGMDANDPNDGDNDPIDFWFHGTHVAGTIGAVGDNGIGVTGVCWDVRLMALKIFADDSDIVPGVFASDAIEAIQYAVSNGAKVINASWGGDYYSEGLREAIAEAGTYGVLFVAAAGNDYGSDNDLVPFYPASFELDNIISVMSTDQFDQMSYFSNYGAKSVDVGEPGSEILSTFPTYPTLGIMIYGLGLDYEVLSGTSMAAPHVSGACALLLSKNPSLPSRIVKQLVLDNVDPVLPGLCTSGGRVNVYSALQAIPEGTMGRVLNTRDDPCDPGNLYDSIQATMRTAATS